MQPLILTSTRNDYSLWPLQLIPLLVISVSRGLQITSYNNVVNQWDLVPNRVARGEQKDDPSYITLISTTGDPEDSSMDPNPEQPLFVTTKETSSVVLACVEIAMIAM